MIYVQRDDGGAIKGLFAQRQPGLAEEVLAEDAVEVQAFKRKFDPVLSPAQESILSLERQQRAKMTDRADREFRVGVMEAIAALQSQATGVPLPALLAQMVVKNKGYREMKDLDDQITALRSQL